MTTTLNFGIVAGLTAAEQQQLSDLAEAYTYHQSRNATKDKYYEGHVTLRDVNLGIALPTGLRGLEVGCSWFSRPTVPGRRLPAAGCCPRRSHTRR